MVRGDFSVTHEPTTKGLGCPKVTTAFRLGFPSGKSVSPTRTQGQTASAGYSDKKRGVGTKTSRSAGCHGCTTLT